jgi:transcriptional regulator with XRE-family HTH domain
MASSPRHVTPPAEARIGEVLRRLRERQGLSLRTLATRAGFSASFLSQLENGQVSPSIASLDRIAGKLGVTLVDLFEATQEREAVVVRAGSRPGFTSSWSRARVESLVGPGTRRPFEALCITLSPKGSSGKSLAGHDSDQFAYVLEGLLTLYLNDEAHALSMGDAVVIPKGHPHRWENGAARPAQVLFVSARFEA